MTYQIWNDPNSPKATGFNDWWELFQEEHEEWKFADREALLKAAFDAGRGLAPLPVQNSVAVVERDNGGEIGTFFNVPIESLEGRSLYLSPFDTPGYVLVPVGPSVPPETPEPVAEAIVIHDIDGDEVITFNIIHPELIKDGTQLYISRGVK